MICPATNDWCRTNGCGERCHKVSSLGKKVHSGYTPQREGFEKLREVKIFIPKK